MAKNLLLSGLFVEVRILLDVGLDDLHLQMAIDQQLVSFRLVNSPEDHVPDGQMSEFYQRAE